MFFAKAASRFGKLSFEPAFELLRLIFLTITYLLLYDFSIYLTVAFRYDGTYNTLTIIFITLYFIIIVFTMCLMAYSINKESKAVLMDEIVVDVSFIRRHHEILLTLKRIL
jgi:hypothetical protein